LNFRHLESGIAVVLAASLFSAEYLQAAAPVIGTADAKGSFRIDGATVARNANLFEGSSIETAAIPSWVRIEAGTRLALTANSRGTVFRDHIFLDRGQTEIERAGNYQVEAKGLRVIAETDESAGRVALSGPRRVQVSSDAGSFRVVNDRGVLVARLMPGAALAFELQNSALTKIAGRVENRGGHYVITDETTNVTVEIIGQGVAKEVGKRVEVTGNADPAAIPVKDATQVIRATSIQRLPSTGTAAAGSSTAPGPGSGLALSGTGIAIIGGVAAAAVVGGLAAAGGLSQSDTATLSR
jgi:hypothetical protein